MTVPAMTYPAMIVGMIAAVARRRKEPIFAGAIRKTGKGFLQGCPRARELSLDQVLYPVFLKSSDKNLVSTYQIPYNNPQGIILTRSFNLFNNPRLFGWG
jgi:hypothetical protein